MQDADKAGDEVSAFIQLVEKPEDDTADGLEEAVKQGTVVQEEGAQILINGEDNMPVSAAEEFKGHFSGAVNVFHDNGTGMKYVHKSIMQEMWPESNPLPSRLRGRGS